MTSTLARIKKAGKHFEIMVDLELALKLRKGAAVNIQNVLLANDIFTNHKTSSKAASADLVAAFGTSDVFAVADRIVKKGDIQLPTDIKRKKTEEKRKQVAAMISRNAHNPQTGIPHPQERILNAMAQTHINIDPFKPAEQQIDDVIKAIKEILPISMEEITINVLALPQHAAAPRWLQS